MPEQARLAQPESLKRGSAATMESIAESTGGACASGTLGVNFGMDDRVNLTLELRSGIYRIRLNDLVCDY